MIGVIYLARGKDENWQKRFTRFVESYQRHPAGIEHRVYVIFKDFASDADLCWAIQEFELLNPIHIMDYVKTNSFAGGSFLEAANSITEPLICCLGSSSEIMHDNWLKILYDGYMSRPNVGLTCCTGSYGYIVEFFPKLTYPNPHVRNLSFLISRRLYQKIAGDMPFESKLNDLEFEHGPNSLTRQVLDRAMEVLVVEKNAIRAPHEWGGEGGTTYRGNLHNVLVHDRCARDKQGDL